MMKQQRLTKFTVITLFVAIFAYIIFITVISKQNKEHYAPQAKRPVSEYTLQYIKDNASIEDQKKFKETTIVV